MIGLMSPPQAQLVWLMLLCMSAVTGCDREPSDRSSPVAERPLPAPLPVPTQQSEPTTPDYVAEVDLAEKILARVDVVDVADGCDAGGSLVYSGIDGDGDGVLSRQEQHEPPMRLCTTDAVETRVINVGPNAYCPRPNVVIEIEHSAARSELIVCLDATAQGIESSYVVYMPR